MFGSVTTMRLSELRRMTLHVVKEICVTLRVRIVSFLQGSPYETIMGTRCAPDTVYGYHHTFDVRNRLLVRSV